MKLISKESADKAIEVLCKKYNLAYGEDYGSNGFGAEVASCLDDLPVFDTTEFLEKVQAHGLKMSTVKAPHTYFKAISVNKVNELFFTEEVSGDGK